MRLVGHRKDGQVDSADEEQLVIQSFRQNPVTSLRRVAAHLSLSKSKVWRTSQKEKLHPLHYCPVQDLLPGDNERRLKFCYWMLEKCAEETNFLKYVFWTDESIFNRDQLPLFA